MAWRAGGDGRPVSFPELPWKRDEPEHDPMVAVSEAEGGVDGKGRVFPKLAPMYYMTCKCGANSTLYPHHHQAQLLADIHRAENDEAPAT